MSNVAEAMTPDAIAARIDAINSLIEAEERAARDLALPAAAGSDEAVAAYAEAVQKINGLHADKTLLAAAAAVAASQASSRSAAEAEAARALIRDLDLVPPGLIHSLNASGAGNHPKIIKAAIAEARRRGYGRR